MTQTVALTNIAFDLSIEELMQRARLLPDTDEAEEFAEWVNRARKIARPKALYKECYLESKGEERVTIEGVAFASRTLRKNLDQVERAFPFVVTCGRELDELSPPAGDFLQAFWWDTIKFAVLGCAGNHLSEHLTRKFALGKTSSMSPGAGDATVWPIQQQRELFALLGDVKERIGVELTDSCLMVPLKSVSGIRFPTEVDFQSCQVCHRENCPSRRAPFDKKLWESLQRE